MSWIEFRDRQVRQSCRSWRSHRQYLPRPTPSDAERTCRAVGPTQFTQTQQDGPVCVMSGVSLWTGRLLWTCSDFKFSVGDSLELSGIQFTHADKTVLSCLAWRCELALSRVVRRTAARHRLLLRGLSSQWSGDDIVCRGAVKRSAAGSRRLCDDLITRRMQARRGWFTASIAAARLIPCTLLTVAGRHQSIRTRYGRRCGRVIRSLKRDITVNGGNSRECLWEVALLTRNERFRNPCVPYCVSKFCC